MSFWMKIALFFTQLIFKLKKALGLAGAPAALPEDSGSAFSLQTIKKAAVLDGNEKYAGKAKGLKEVVKLECAGKSALVKMDDGSIKIMESGVEPTATVSFSESGWAAMMNGEDIQKLVMSGELKFSGDLSRLMSHMGALKLLFLCIMGKFDPNK